MDVSSVQTGVGSAQSIDRGQLSLDRGVMEITNNSVATRSTMGEMVTRLISSDDEC